VFRYLLTIALFAVFGISYGEQYDFEKNGISYVWEKMPDFLESKRIYLEAFTKCYSSYPLEVFKLPAKKTVEQMIEEIFDQVYVDYQSSESYRWLSAKVNDHLIGFLLIDMVKGPEEVYLAHLAIDPSYQGRGIASTMIKSLYDQFPKCVRFVVITRQVNEGAKALYHALGFIPSPYMHEGYSAEMYTGYELLRSSNHLDKMLPAPF